MSAPAAARTPSVDEMFERGDIAAFRDHLKSAKPAELTHLMVRASARGMNAFHDAVIGAMIVRSGKRRRR